MTSNLKVEGFADSEVKLMTLKIVNVRLLAPAFEI